MTGPRFVSQEEKDTDRRVFESRFLKLCYGGVPHRFVHEGRHLLMAYNPGAKRQELMELIDNG